MGRSRKSQQSSQQVTVMEDTSLDRLVARAVSRLAPLLPPWAGTAGVGVAAVYTHDMWASSPWAAMGMQASTLGLTGLTWLTSHARALIGRVHAAGTTLAAGGWLTVATITGPGAAGTLDVLLLGGATVALSWNIRHVVRGDDDTSGDRYQVRWGELADKLGLSGRWRTLKASERKTTARVELEPGTGTAADVQHRKAALESGNRLPPGSMVVSANPDRADWADVSITDPRLIREPQPWPGPSRPGASIAEPLRTGLYQDGEDVAYTITGHHLQVMGMTGSAKSFGAAWNLLGEAMTRTDVALWGADLTKGRQTFGPLAPALDWLAVDKPDAVRMVTAVERAVRPRTDYLTSRGLQNWEPGCGLTYLIVLLEEAPDVLDAVNLERFVATLKAARSAGIKVVMSLQRSDWTQMPTLARGQLGGFACFGVANSQDASFGLPEAVREAGAEPENWGQDWPGMHYLSAPTIPQGRRAMPARSWYWTTEAMLAHAQQWPATDRPLDAVTIEAAGDTYTPSSAGATAHGHQAQPAEEDETEPTIEERMTIPDPAPELTADIDDPIEDTEPPVEFMQPSGRRRASSEEARSALADQLQAWAREGRAEFRPRDLRPLLNELGMSRAWAHKQLAALAEAGEIEHDTERAAYQIRIPAPA